MLDGDALGIDLDGADVERPSSVEVCGAVANEAVAVTPRLGLSAVVRLDPVADVAAISLVGGPTVEDGAGADGVGLVEAWALAPPSLLGASSSLEQPAGR